MTEKKVRNAFIFRISEFKRRSVKLALENDRLYAGWSRSDLTNPLLNFADFKEKILEVNDFKPEETRRISQTAGNIWRFIREIEIGDYVIVPDSKCFYVCEIIGPVEYIEKDKEFDGAHQRRVKWLNNKKPISRNRAPAKLQLRMKAHHTCTRASEFVNDINEMLIHPNASFDDDLERKLIELTHKELTNGRMNDWNLEKLVKKLIDNLTNSNSEIIPRKDDKGADIISTVGIGDIGEYTLAVQVKHHDQSINATKNEVIDQLIEGMNAEGAFIGWVVTTGEFKENVEIYKSQKEEESGYKIELIDGKRLAEIIIRNGISILD